MTKSIFTTLILFVAFNCFAGNDGEPIKNSTSTIDADAKNFVESNLTPAMMDSDDDNVDLFFTQEEIMKVSTLAALTEGFIADNLIPLEMDSEL